MPSQIIPGINPALVPIIPVKADRIPPHGCHRLRPRRSLIHRQQRLWFRFRLTRPASRFLPLIVARRARTCIAQPGKCPVAAVPVLPLNLHAGAAALVHAHLRRGLRVGRQLMLPRLRAARLFFADKADAFVAHLFQSTAHSYLSFSARIARARPSVTRSPESQVASG